MNTELERLWMETAVPTLRCLYEGTERSHINMYHDSTMYPWFSVVVSFVKHLYTRHVWKVKGLTLSNPIFLPTAYSPAFISLPFSYKHNRANTIHNHLFTSKHMAGQETERVQPVLSVGQSPYYMWKSI